MSDGALSEDDIVKMLSNDSNEELKEIVEKSSYLSKEDKDDYTFLLNVLDNADNKKNQEFSLENRELKFSVEQVNKISVIYEKFASLAAKRIYDKIKCAVFVNFASVNQLTVKEFSLCLPTPTLLGFFNMLNGNCVVEIDTITAFAIIDMFHQKTLETTKSLSELNENDKSIIKELFIDLMQDMKEAWKDIINIQPKLVKIKSNPKSIDIAAAEEMTAIITLQTKIIDVFSSNPADGMINICLPYSVFEDVLEKL